ncbi:MAG: site-specific integrase, partial [Runella zeae]
MAKKTTYGITFVLREPTSENPQPIHLIVRFNNDRVRISTGVKVLPEYWDFVRCRVRNVAKAIGKDGINTLLSKLSVEADSLLTELKTSRNLTKEILRERLEELVRPKALSSVSKESALFGFIKEFIEKSPERINPANGKKIEYRTIQKYKTVFSVLQDFAKSYPRKIDFDTIDLDFYGDFTEYLTNKKQFAANNVGKYVQTLKVFLNEATAKGINTKSDYKSRRFKVVKENADSIYLSEKELQSLYEFDLSKNTRLERVRDLFIVGCWTGLRFSDLVSISPEHVRQGIITIEQSKTGFKVIIPCHPIVRAIMDKYKGSLPRAISNQKMNDYLKELCKLSGMVEIVHKSITKGG